MTVPGYPLDTTKADGTAQAGNHPAHHNALATAVNSLSDTTDTNSAAISSNTSRIAAVESGKQPLDPDLTALAGVASAPDQVPYFTGQAAAAVTAFTSTGRALVGGASASAMRGTLGVAIGTVENNPAVAPARRPMKADTTTAYAPVFNTNSASSDENRMITLSNAAAITVTMPSDATQAFVIGTEIDFLQLGAGQVTFVAGASAFVNGTPGLKMRAQYSKVAARKIAANTWVVYGDLSA